MTDIADSQARRLSNAFQIKSLTKSFTVIADVRPPSFSLPPHPFSKQFFTFVQDSKDKTAWLQGFKDAHERLAQSNLRAKAAATDATAPVWVPDSEVKACTICCADPISPKGLTSHLAAKFTLTFRRHHCRQCGLIICANCWTHKKELPGQGKQRVCDTCFKKPADWKPENVSRPPTSTPSHPS